MIKIVYIPTKDIVADGLTKPLTGAKFQQFMKLLQLNKWRITPQSAMRGSVKDIALLSGWQMAGKVVGKVAGQHHCLADSWDTPTYYGLQGKFWEFALSRGRVSPRQPYAYSYLHAHLHTILLCVYHFIWSPCALRTSWQRWCIKSINSINWSTKIKSQASYTIFLNNLYKILPFSYSGYYSWIQSFIKSQTCSIGLRSKK